MRIRSIKIQRSPGISSEFEIDGFGEGLTLISGRNESGKSTLAMAIRTLLWPDRHDDLEASGRFAIDDREFNAFVGLRGGDWQGSAPPMPDRSAARGLVIGIGDLWHEDDHHESIRQSMARELQGGYDLAALQRTLEPKSPTAPMRDLAGARDALESARANASALHAQEARLPALRERVAALGKQANEKPQIEAAISRLDRLASLAADEQQLAQLPEGALKLNGDEGRHAASFQRAIDDSAASVEKEADAADAAQVSLDALRLPDGGIEPGDLELLASLSQDAESLRQQIAQARQHSDGAAAAAEAVASNGTPMDAAALDRLDHALLNVQHARERMSRDVAAAEHTDQPRSAGGRTLASALLVGTLAAAIASGIAGAWLALAASAITCVLAAIAARHLLSNASAPDPRLREQAERSSRAHEESLADLRSIDGMDSELTSTLSIVVAAKRAERADDALRQLHAARAAEESLEDQLCRTIERAAAPLARCGLEPCDNADGLIRALANAKARAAEHDRLVRERDAAELRAADERRRLAQTRQDYERFLSRLGLTEDRLDELRVWLQHRERAQGLSKQIHESRAVLSSIDGTLEATPRLLGLDLAALRLELQECERSDAERSDIDQEIGKIEGAVRESKQQADVQAAVGAVEAAAQAVAQARDHECAKAARRLTLEHAASGLQRNDMPALVREADAMLARFTAGAYGLRIDGSGQPVLYDSREGVAKTSEQLSTGTRAQIMLALRLAGTREAERRAGSGPLPLVLDEPLATTDRGRFKAVAGALLELVREGRQVLYLTCEPAHVATLESAAAESGVPVVALDLNAIRGRQGMERTPRHAIMEPKPEPSPATMAREDYLRARGVAPLDPWAPAEAIDVYHLIADDLGLVHELGQHGITTVGQVLAQHERQGSDFRWPGVGDLASMATRLLETWRRGRSRPFTARDLDASGVAGAYFDRLAGLIEDLGGSARSLIEAVESRSDERAKGFRADKARALRAYMETNSFLPESAPVDRAEAISIALRGPGLGSTAQDQGAVTLANRLLDLFEASQRREREAQAVSEA